MLIYWNYVEDIQIYTFLPIFFLHKFVGVIHSHHMLHFHYRNLVLSILCLEMLNQLTKMILIWNHLMLILCFQQKYVLFFLFNCFFYKFSPNSKSFLRLNQLNKRFFSPMTPLILNIIIDLP